jgi:hypothetical protein
MNANYLKPLAIALLLGLMPLSLTSAVAAVDNRGPAGPAGPTGKAGAKGATGAKGQAGPIGPIGPLGAQGPQGLAGSNGINGTDGTPGAPGASGKLGNKGADGLAGTPGNDGTDGAPGTNGNNGTDAAAGSNGTDAAPGSDGTNGIDGINGQDAPGGSAKGDIRWWNGTTWSVLTAGAHNTHLKNCDGSPTWVVTDCPAGFAIGDTGPGGGIVFLITDAGVHGLEAAPVDQTASAWGCVGTSIAGTSTAVGTGKANTALIVAGCADADTAAKVADAYSIGPFDDWYLPSRDELILLYAQKAVVGGFADDYYWSSSESTGANAWNQFFFIGQGGLGKVGTLPVRAVRAF